MSNKSLLASIIAAFVLVGCDQTAIKEEPARLELAEVKGDLDQIYLSLKKLANKGDKAAQSRLSAIEQAIKAREEMMTAVNDRDHEQAVLAANELLKLHANNKDAIKVLRESGQILYLLRKALDAIAAYRELEPTPIKAVALDVSNVDDPAEKKRLITEATNTAFREMGIEVGDGPLSRKAKNRIEQIAKKNRIAYKGEISEQLAQAILKEAAEYKTQQNKDLYIDAQFQALAQARQAVRRARELDPQFKGSVQLEDLLTEVHDALVWKAIVRAKIYAQFAFIDAKAMYLLALDILNLSASTGYEDIQKTWGRISQDMEDTYEAIQEYRLKRLSREVRRIAPYQTGDLAPIAQLTVRFAATVDAAVRQMMDPAGSLKDYRAVGPAVQAEFGRLIAEIEAIIPNNTDTRVRASMDKLSSYTLFRHAGTDEILAKNEALFAL